MFFEAVSPSMRAVEAVTAELARSEVPVLLLAEAGAGKRTTAERIHSMSRHNAEPFRAIDCSSLGPEQFQTRAERLFHEGTVFLAEITDLSLPCQGKLLDILPNCGENGHGPLAGARLIFGSSRDLEREVQAGRFREDLYYRISGVCLRLPPLRQRKEDIPYLVSFFLEKYAQNFQRSAPVLSAETQHLFREYSWPGNVRELEDAAKAIVALGDEAVAMGGLRSLLVKSDRAWNGERISLKQAARAASREAEKELILKVLTRTRWNRRRAAQVLQISYKALLYKLKEISDEDVRSILNSQERI
jgi:two-component system, NtrC family, response regulator AtoC